MPVLVIGCGSIGQRHLRNLRALGLTDVLAYDPLPARMDRVVEDPQVIPVPSIEDGLHRRPQVVLVCTPPNSHTPLALQAVTAGCHVFVEKPLADKLDGVDALLAEGARRGRNIYVGYNLRFHAGLLRTKQLLDEGAIGHVMSIRAEMGQYLPDWRPAQDYRESYTASAAKGGGIILDASHEIDYVRWLGGEVERVYCAAGKISALELDAEDAAEMTLWLRGNVLAQIHMDCIQRGYARNCKLIGDKGTLIWDFKTGVRYYDAEVNRWYEESIVPDPNEMYLQELRCLLACVQAEPPLRDPVSPLADGRTGRRVLEIALASKQSARERREVPV